MNGSPQAVSFSRKLTELAEAGPDRPAITIGDTTMTRMELERSSNRLARLFSSLGVGRDDHVAITLPNSFEFLEAMFAAWKLGATPLPLSYRLPNPELRTLVELADPKLVMGRPAEEFPERICLPPGQLVAEHLEDTPLEDRVAEPWKMLPSGGSTGRPKLIVGRGPGTMDSLDPLIALMRVERNRAHLVPGPLYHATPYVTATAVVLHGNHLVMQPRFDPLETMQALERWRVDYLTLVPTMMHRIWRLGREVLDGFDLSALRIVLHMAAPCAPWLKDAWIEWLGPERIHELYGGTELQALTWISGEEWLTHRGSVGKVIAGSMKVLDASGQPLPAGEVGEIYMLPDNGVGSTYRYIGAEPRQQGDWESLGDMGWMDEEGYVYLTDRLTDMILSGGANIYPAEVEAALDAHPAVRSSCVIGLPDEDLGARTHALIDTVDTVSEEALRDHVAGLLAPYKIPRSFEYVSEPLRDDAGKVRRSALREARLASGT